MSSICEQFIRWLLVSEPRDIQILKTELNQEPIRADSVTFLQTANQILHIEFQTLPTSPPPVADARLLAAALSSVQLRY